MEAAASGHVRFGSLVATEPVEVRHDLDGVTSGFWAVVADFEGSLTAVRLARATDPAVLRESVEDKEQRQCDRAKGQPVGSDALEDHATHYSVQRRPLERERSETLPPLYKKTCALQKLYIAG